jgi:hypothetical protein
MAIAFGAPAMALVIPFEAVPILRRCRIGAIIGDFRDDTGGYQQPAFVAAPRAP